MSGLFLFFSFLLSHPLYFSYFIFFSPYLLKLISFLSPLFITTSLLLLTLLTFSPGLIHDNSSSEFSETKPTALLSTYHTIVKRLQQSKIDDETEDFYRIEDLEVYKIVFDTSMLDVRGVEALESKSEESCSPGFEAPVLKCSSHAQDSGTSICERLTGNSVESPCEIAGLETNLSVMEEKRLQGFLKVLDEFENMIASNVEDKKVEPPGAKIDKVVEEQKEESLVRSGSEATGNKISDATVISVSTDDRREEYTKSQRLVDNGNGVVKGEEFSSVPKVDSSRTLDYNLGSYGSMRKEKEWKRTLACKLFEERHNVDGGTEGMDSLWETYEVDSTKANPKSNTKKKKKIKKKEETETELYYDNVDDEEEEEMNDRQQLCCLQAFKFSAGKMNLGMGRPNLVKISKALKGFGWLHHVSRHGKKVHNGDRF